MAEHTIISMVALTTLLILMAIQTSAESLGVCYGMDADNLPQPIDVVALYKANSITRMRLYSPNPAVLQVLGGSTIDLVVGVPNSDLQSLASDPAAATNWVQTNIEAYPNVSFRYIAVGNEVPSNQTQYILPTMQNIQSAVTAAGLQNNVKVSAAVSQAVLTSPYPLYGEFSDEAKAYLAPIVEQFLVTNNSPLLVNVYPYFTYLYHTDLVNLSYALFTAPGTVVQKGEYAYQNLFDELVDALYSALETVGGSGVEIVVSESGWPSANGTWATILNAQTYNSNLIKHVGKGTPKKPRAVETYVFAMFNEDLKPPNEGTERYFGLFYPNKQPVYPISFT